MTESTISPVPDEKINNFSLHGFFRWQNFAWLILLFLLSLWINCRGITVGLPSRERLEISLGGAAAVEKNLPVIRESLSNGIGQRSEFIDKTCGENFKQLAELSPYLDQVRSANPDEFMVFKVLANMHKNRTIITGTYIYGPFFFYQIGASLVIGKILGIIDTAHPATYFLCNPDKFASYFLCGRLLSALFGALTIGVVFLIGYRIGRLPLAVLAAGILAFIPLFSLAAKFIKADSPLMFWTSLTIFFAVPVIDSAKWRFYILTGVCIGLSTATKYPAAVNASFLVMFHLLRRFSEFKKCHKLINDDWKLIVAGLIAVSAFLLSSPPVLLDWRTFWYDLSWIQSVSRDGSQVFNILDSLICYLYDAFFYTVGIPGTIAVVVGLIFALVKPEKIWLGMFPGIILYLFIASRGLATSDAYMLPAYIPLCLMAGRAINAIPWQFLKRIAGGIVIVGTFSYSYAYTDAALAENSRITAINWINSNIPAGSSLGTVWYPVNYRVPMVSPERYRLVNLKTDGTKAFSDADYFLDSSYEWLAKDFLSRIRYGDEELISPGIIKIKEFEYVPRAFFGLLPLTREHRLNLYFEVICPKMLVYKNGKKR